MTSLTISRRTFCRLLLIASLCFTHALAIAKDTVQISGTGFTIETLKDGIKTFGNRPYQWSRVPSKFSGWQYTRFDGGKAAEVTVESASGDALFLVTQANKPITSSEWKKCGSFQYQKPGNGTSYVADVFTRPYTPDEKVVIPQGNFSGGMLIAPEISAKIEKPVYKLDLSNAPGVVITHSPANSRKYIGSPSIAVLPNGDYIASHDLFGPGSTFNASGQTFIYRSSDKGKTWALLTELKDQFWGTLFVHNSDLYIMGTNKRFGNAIIRKSTDGGVTWTEPSDSSNGVLVSDRRCHTAPMPMLEHNGRLWRTMEDVDGAEHWGAWFEAFMMSVPVEADLLNADNWILSNRVKVDTSWKNGKFKGFLEGNAVVLPDGQVADVLRAELLPHGETAAVIRISDDGQTASFDPQTDFVPFPGGNVKFTVRYDDESEKYWTISNWVAPGYSVHREYMALSCSSDFKTWEIKSIVMFAPPLCGQGFQYVDWVF